MEREHSQLGTGVVRHMYVQVLLYARFISDFPSYPRSDCCPDSMARLHTLHYPPPLQDCHLCHRINKSGRGTCSSPVRSQERIIQANFNRDAVK